MIPNLAKSGGSFRGAGLYYLHDKADSRDTPRAEKPGTSERVWFTGTRNCACDDPQQAIDEMWKTAEYQDFLKRSAGVRPGGRPCDKPVQTISLSWHPSERPEPAAMMQAADEFMKHMGWHEHQALYVGHKDTDHPHIHIIMNRVHPETGMTANSRNDYKRAQEWALEFERAHGRIWCERRVEAENDNHRAANTNVPHHVHDIMRDSEKAYQRDEARRAGAFAFERDQMKAAQRAERESWFAAGKSALKQARHDAFDAVKEEFRAEWAGYHKERLAQENAAEASFTNLMDRAFHFAQSGEWIAANRAFEARDAKIEAVRDVFDVRQADLHARQKAAWEERQRDACQQLRMERDAGYKELLKRQQSERDEMKAAHARGERASGLAGESQSARKANDNARPVAATPAPAIRNEPHPDRENTSRGIQIGQAPPKTPATHTPEVARAAPAPAAYADRGSQRENITREIPNAQTPPALSAPRTPEAARVAPAPIPMTSPPMRLPPAHAQGLFGRSQNSSANPYRPSTELADAEKSRKNIDAATRPQGAPAMAPPSPAPTQQPARAHGQASTNLGWGDSAPTKAEIDAARVAREEKTRMPAQPLQQSPPRERTPDTATKAAGVIGGIAGYVADQMAEFFAPTPPEVRQARQIEDAKREAEKPIVEVKDQNPYARHIEAALRRAESEQEQKRERDYWDDRARSRDR